MLGREGCDFSFAGLKTALVREVERLGALTEQDKADLCASFQAAVVDVVADRTKNAMRDVRPGLGRERTAGRGWRRRGQSGDPELSGRVWRKSGATSSMAPPLKWCTDNAAMIALAGAERLRAGFRDDLEAPARPRWPLDEVAARLRPSHKPGRKGAKA